MLSQASRILCMAKFALPRTVPFCGHGACAMGECWKPLKGATSTAADSIALWCWVVAIHMN